MPITGLVADQKSGLPLGGVEVDAVDPSTDGVFASVVTDASGSFAVYLDGEAGIKAMPGPHPDQMTFRLSRDGAWLGEYAVRIKWTSLDDGIVRIDVAQGAPPGRAYTISGHVLDRATGGAVLGITVEAWDGSGRYPSPIGPATTDTAGAFALSVARQGDPPDATFRLYRQGQPLAVQDVALTPSADGLGAEIQVQATTGVPQVYTLVGHTNDRVSRRATPGLRVELWSPDFAFMLTATVTDANGGFSATLAEPAPGQPPQPRLRLYRDAQLVGQPEVATVWSSAGTAEVWIDVDAPPEAPRAFRVTGRIVDRTAGTGVAGLRVEAWNKAPRDGGFIGVAADTDSEGAVDISFPRTEELLAVAPPLVDRLAARPAGTLALARLQTTPPILARPAASTFTPPDLFFRIYRDDTLVTTVDANVQWGPAAVGQTVIEIDPPTDAPASTEVGLHELGQSIAGTVQRVQAELARYPDAVGAYVLDEINLTIPVEMRVDEIGQLMAKVANTETPSEAQVGQVQMRVRPVLGAVPPPTDVPEQPLSELCELSTDAVAKLEAQRIFSVGDLARAARAAAGRAALAALLPGFDLDPLLDKAALLSLPMLPVPVREALLHAGISSPRTFVAAEDAAGLALQLSAELERTVTSTDVKSWQQDVEKALDVPLPSDELDHALIEA